MVKFYAEIIILCCHNTFKFHYISVKIMIALKFFKRHFNLVFIKALGGRVHTIFLMLCILL
jgi:hypothetical protein